MSFFQKLGSLFSGKKSSEDAGANAFYFYVACNSCGEKIRVRVDKAYDLQQEFDEVGDTVSGYVLSKEVLGKKCFKPIHVDMVFDKNKEEMSRDIKGGKFITREEYAESEAQPSTLS